MNELKAINELNRLIHFKNTRDKTRINIDKCLELLNKLDTEGGRIAFILIRMYALQHKQGKMFDLPFQGKVIKESQGMLDIEFDAKTLPEMLQKMLLLFCKKHVEQLQFEAERMITF